MKRQSGPKKIKKAKLDYEIIGKNLRQFCNNDNDGDVSEAGPYAQTALSLSWSNSITNRKYLQVIWRGGIGVMFKIQIRLMHKQLRPPTVKPKTLH